MLGQRLSNDQNYNQRTYTDENSLDTTKNINIPWRFDFHEKSSS